jgi:hypothetical protein
MPLLSESINNAVDRHRNESPLWMEVCKVEQIIVAYTTVRIGDSEEVCSLATRLS